MILLDLFLGGADTTSKVLSFAVLYTVLYPEVQRKIQAEINDVISDEETMLSINHLDKMPYMKATMYETFRFASFVPLPVIRRTLDDYIYNNYFIPKGTGIAFNMYPHFNEKGYWGDPEIFRPERFLNQNGTKVINTERVTAFGFGKRICLGQTLAWSAFFLSYGTLLRHFNLETVPGEEPPLVDAIETASITLSPKPFRVLLKTRM